MASNVKAVYSENKRFVRSNTITRPTDTTTYAAGDVISDATGNAHFTFDGVLDVVRKNTATITGLKIYISALVATGPDLELWLFHTDIATKADNLAAAVTDAENLTCIGKIDIPTADFNAAGANNFQQITKLDVPIKVLGSANKIYGQLIVRNAYVPTSGETYTVELDIRQD